MSEHKVDPFVDVLDSILDCIRVKAIQERPGDVLKFISKSIEQLENEQNSVETCERIVSKVPQKILEKPLSLVILGASGDLAKKKTFPALFQLFCNGMLPRNVNIIGYARTEIPDVEKWKKEVIQKFFQRLDVRGCHVEEFLRRITYVSGQYTKVEDFQRLDQAIQAREKEFQGEGKGGNRLFYLALPPSAFVDAATGIRQACMPTGDGWIRVIIEKPFGRDTDTSAQLSSKLEPLFSEPQIFRIDHYLGKEMVQNILTVRFANRIFNSIWNAQNISNVQITFKETIGTEGRGGYFDSFGIIRDVIQNHLTQILALVGMGKPNSLDAESIRDAKVAVLRSIEPVTKENCVLGQYTASEDGKIPGYLDDPTVPKGSKCPTFAMIRLFINNDQWDGVPFILKAGKALEDKAVVIRIQFKDELRPYGEAAQRNELVIRAQPSEAMYIKITNKAPGITEDLRGTHQTELDLTYHSRYGVYIPDAYESLINECILGNSTNFVRKDELDAAWKIFTPLLHQIDQGHVTPIPYKAGSRGPKEADEMLISSGFKYQEGYKWSPQNKL
ncbi:glucose-6-phosphate 1-dehydrogenase [Angomonas deanei]|nr:glucose-6-phosphate 1-dehydrogenase [Angomonas deanei]|eukprot:EPY38481.1 glucose-6-phosphate 1-dehydrogenase [Angomonas deanei]